jgi:hypothetical protein
MSVKFGFPALSNRAVNTNTSRKKSGKKNKPLVIRVTDMILDENHPLIKNGKYGLNSLGLIIGVGTLPSNFSRLFTALPANPNLKKIPTINEHVEIFQSTIPNSNGIQWLYKEPLGLFGSSTPNGNQFPSTTYNINPPTQNISYTQASLGAVNVVSPTPPEIPVTSIVNPSQATYVAKSDINPLLPFEGDIIHEGRFGSSLRFGSTAKSKSQYANNWSTAGENGDPITILRNGQSPNSPKDGWIPVTEDISNDLSSIYLTSYQKIPIGLSNEHFISYTTKPILPGVFTLPQVIINSERVVLNAKTDSVLISAQKSVGLLSNESVNIESKQICISGNEVKLGGTEAEQPVLKGNETVTLLKQMATEIRNIAKSLETIQTYLNGVPTPDATIQPVAQLATNNLNKILSRLNDDVTGIKSNFVKVK